MTALIEVASHIPEAAESVEEAGRRIGISAMERRLFSRFFGLREIRVAPDRSYADRLVDAARELEGLKGAESRVKYFMAARTFRDVLPATEDAVQEAADRLGLDEAVCLAVTDHACASGLLAVWTAGWLLRDHDPEDMALIVTGEIAPSRGFYLPGTTLMGDSTAACLVGAHGQRDRLISYDYRMNPSIDETVELASSHLPDISDGIHKYNEVSNEEMKRIYTTEIAEVIRSAAAQAGVSLDELPLILPHNVNRISWVRVCEALDYPIGSVMLDCVPYTGHCFTADGFINYVEAKRQNRIEPGQLYMMVGIGMGGSFAAMVFRH